MGAWRQLKWWCAINKIADPVSLLPVPASLAHLRSVDENDPRANRRPTGIDLWVDEFIWGHRLIDQAGAWLGFMEFLSMVEGLDWTGRAFADDAPYPLTFQPAQRMHMRNLLFQSDHALRAAEIRPEGQQWSAFIAVMNETAIGISGGADFAYLKRHFGEFKHLRETINLLRNSRVEAETNKHWSSRFVFPYGRHAIYEDVHISPDTLEPNRKYNVFNRNGELLYLMLTRSRHRASLAQLADRMMAGTGPWDKLVSLLEPHHDHQRPTRSQSYLPYRTHPIFDALAEDWLAVDELRLPGYDAYPHLVNLAGLHLVRYFVTIAAGWAGKGDGLKGPAMICEIIAPKKTPVRDLSIENFARNDLLSITALEATIARIASTATWRAAVNSGGDTCWRLLADVLLWDDGAKGASPAELLRDLANDARVRHQQHLGNFHRAMGRSIGLISRRGTNRFRYAPTDALIKTLLLTVVPQRMEFGEFLSTLYARYGLVIGPVEAADALRDTTRFDQKTLRENARRLEDRLASLGLLRRLSDACAYVINPYSESSSGQRGASRHA